MLLLVFFFCPFRIAISSLGEDRANLSFFVRLLNLRLFGFVCFTLPLGVWEGLRREGCSL